MLVQSRRCPGCGSRVGDGLGTVPEVRACPDCGYVPAQGAD